MKHHLCPPDLKLTTILFGHAIFLCGCSSSYLVSSTGKPDAEYSYREMNEELKGRDATIELKDGRDMSAKEVKISNDSASWVDASSDRTFSIVATEVKTIVDKNHGVGGLEGLGFGIIPGALLGGVYGSSDEAKSFFGSEAPLEFAALLGSVTGIIGGIVGLIVGHSYEYQFLTRGDSKKK